jgi:Cu(I)/Ag(I) efflux system periplasmic protein CusF
MNKTFTSLIAVTVALLASPAFATSDHSQHQQGAQVTSTPAAMEMISGQVKKVDPTAGSVTLAHGPLTNLGMPAMTMSFKVSNAAWLGQMKAGDKIRFMADKVNGAFTVVHFESVK